MPKMKKPKGRRSGRGEKCGTKVPYSSQEEALKAAQTFYCFRVVTLTPYLCPFCQFWHIGHPD